MSFYRPPVHVMKKQSTVVMNEETFPTLSNLKITTNSANQTNLYKDKLKLSIDQNKNDEKEKSELPKGWIVLDGKYNPKRNKNTKKDSSSKEEEEKKEEKINFDGSNLIHLWKKRREEYINLYGEENYIKNFGYGPYYHFLHLEDDINLNDSNDESLLGEEDNDMSSIE